MRGLGKRRENVKNLGLEPDRHGTGQQADKGHQRKPLLVLTHRHSTGLVLQPQPRSQSTVPLVNNVENIDHWVNVRPMGDTTQTHNYSHPIPRCGEG